MRCRDHTAALEVRSLPKFVRQGGRAGRSSSSAALTAGRSGLPIRRASKEPTARGSLARLALTLWWSTRSPEWLAARSSTLWTLWLSLS